MVSLETEFNLFCGLDEETICNYIRAKEKRGDKQLDLELDFENSGSRAQRKIFGSARIMLLKLRWRSRK